LPVVKINELSPHAPEGGLLASAIEAPVSGEGSETFSFNVAGWAVARDSAVEKFQVLRRGRVVAEVPPNLTATRGGEELPEVEGVRAVGFEVLVRAIEIEPSFDVELVARLADGTACPMGTIKGERELLAVPRVPRLNPAMITTIGRSGSKWLARLMSCHPAVIAFQPLVFEPRVATYWITAMREMTAPKSYLRQIHTERWDEPRWWLGDGASGLPAPVELAMAEWLGNTSVRSLGAISQERIETFYREVAVRSGKGEGLQFFAEKFLLDPVLLDLTLEVFPGGREVILVRDFRDRLSSVFAWNEKRSDHGFGHAAEMSKAEYLTERVRADADDLLERWKERGDAALLVRYEDLILEPAVTLNSLFAYLGIDAGEATVQAVLDEATQPNEMLDTHRTVKDPTKTIGRWRRDLPEDLADECNELLAPVLEAFGYSV
jgi:hypothetical protein